MSVNSIFVYLGMTFNMKEVLFLRMLMYNPDSAKEIKKKIKTTVRLYFVSQEHNVYICTHIILFSHSQGAEP